MFIKIQDNGDIIYYSLRKLKEDNPNVSFPLEISDTLLETFNVFRYTVENEPDYNTETQHLMQQPLPVFENSKWVLKYDVVDYTEEELQNIRNEKINNYKLYIQNYLDNTARGLGYDGIISLCTYATSTDTKFSQEGSNGVKFRDIVWNQASIILDDVLNGVRSEPTKEELLSELPTWDSI